MELDFRNYCLCGMRMFFLLYLENTKGLLSFVAKLLTRVTDCTVCGYRLFLLCTDGD